MTPSLPSPKEVFRLAPDQHRAFVQLWTETLVNSGNHLLCDARQGSLGAALLVSLFSEHDVKPNANFAESESSFLQTLCIQLSVCIGCVKRMYESVTDSALVGLLDSSSAIASNREAFRAHAAHVRHQLACFAEYRLPRALLSAARPHRTSQPIRPHFAEFQHIDRRRPTRTARALPFHKLGDEWTHFLVRPEDQHLSASVRLVNSVVTPVFELLWCPSLLESQQLVAALQDTFLRFEGLSASRTNAARTLWSQMFTRIERARRIRQGILSSASLMRQTSVVKTEHAPPAAASLEIPPALTASDSCIVIDDDDDDDDDEDPEADELLSQAIEAESIRKRQQYFDSLDSEDASFEPASKTKDEEMEDNEDLEEIKEIEEIPLNTRSGLVPCLARHFIVSVSMLQTQFGNAPCSAIAELLALFKPALSSSSSSSSGLSVATWKDVAEGATTTTTSSTHLQWSPRQFESFDAFAQCFQAMLACRGPFSSKEDQLSGLGAWIRQNYAAAAAAASTGLAARVAEPDSDFEGCPVSLYFADTVENLLDRASGLVHLIPIDPLPCWSTMLVLLNDLDANTMHWAFSHGFDRLYHVIVGRLITGAQSRSELLVLCQCLTACLGPLGWQPDPADPTLAETLFDAIKTNEFMVDIASGPDPPTDVGLYFEWSLPLLSALVPHIEACPTVFRRALEWFLVELPRQSQHLRDRLRASLSLGFNLLVRLCKAAPTAAVADANSTAQRFILLDTASTWVPPVKKLVMKRNQFAFQCTQKLLEADVDWLERSLFTVSTAQRRSKELRVVIFDKLTKDAQAFEFLKPFWESLVVMDNYTTPADKSPPISRLNKLLCTQILRVLQAVLEVKQNLQAEAAAQHHSPQTSLDLCARIEEVESSFLDLAAGWLDVLGETTRWADTDVFFHCQLIAYLAANYSWHDKVGLAIKQLVGSCLEHQDISSAPVLLDNTDERLPRKPTPVHEHAMEMIAGVQLQHINRAVFLACCKAPVVVDLLVATVLGGLARYSTDCEKVNRRTKQSAESKQKSLDKLRVIRTHLIDFLFLLVSLARDFRADLPSQVLDTLEQTFVKVFDEPEQNNLVRLVPAMAAKYPEQARRAGCEFNPELDDDVTDMEVDGESGSDAEQSSDAEQTSAEHQSEHKPRHDDALDDDQPDLEPNNDDAHEAPADLEPKHDAQEAPEKLGEADQMLADGQLEETTMAMEVGHQEKAASPPLFSSVFDEETQEFEDPVPFVTSKVQHAPTEGITPMNIQPPVSAAPLPRRVTSLRNRQFVLKEDVDDDDESSDDDLRFPDTSTLLLAAATGAATRTQQQISGSSVVSEEEDAHRVGQVVSSSLQHPRPTVFPTAEHTLAKAPASTAAFSTLPKPTTAQAALPVKPVLLSQGRPFAPQPPRPRSTEPSASSADTSSNSRASPTRPHAHKLLLPRKTALVRNNLQANRAAVISEEEQAAIRNKDVVDQYQPAAATSTGLDPKFLVSYGKRPAGLSRPASRASPEPRYSADIVQQQQPPVVVAARFIPLRQRLLSWTPLALFRGEIAELIDAVNQNAPLPEQMLVNSSPAGQISRKCEGSRVPNVITSWEQYVALFEPRFLLECIHNLGEVLVMNSPAAAQPKDASKPLVLGENCLSRQVTRFGDVSDEQASLCRVKLRSDQANLFEQFFLGDFHILGLPKQTNNGKTGFDPDEALLCQVVSRKADWLEIEVNPSHPAARKVFMNASTLHLFNLGSNPTMNRQHEALSTMQHSDFAKFIFNPKLLFDIIKLARSKPSMDSITYLKTNKELNDSQFEAVKLAMSLSHGLCFWQGPPGTGKTKTILALLGAVVRKSITDAQHRLVPNEKSPELTRRKRILVCAPSNTAVDEIISRCEAELLSVGDLDLSKLPIGFDPSQIVTITQGQHRYRPVVVRFGQSDHPTSLERRLAKRIGNDAISVRDRNALKTEIFMSADIIACTLVSSGLETLSTQVAESTQRLKEQLASRGGGSIVTNQPFFDMLIIDEASQCIELESLIPFRTRPRVAVLVGDPMQLPATVTSMEARQSGLSRSLFERVAQAVTSAPDRAAADSPIRLLSTQYRMAPQIAKFPNREFYEGRLTNFYPDDHFRLPCHEQLQFRPFVFYNVHEGKEKQDKSKINWEEVDTVSRVLQKLHTKYPEMFEGTQPVSIGVLSPYSDQVGLIRKKIDQKLPHMQKFIEVDTVDAFQGREKDIVLFSCVFTDRIGFLADTRRMNVALTRARKCLFVIGRAESLMNGSEPSWRHLVRYAIDKEVMCDSHGIPSVDKFRKTSSGHSSHSDRSSVGRHHRHDSENRRAEAQSTHALPAPTGTKSAAESAAVHPGHRSKSPHTHSGLQNPHQAPSMAACPKPGGYVAFLRQNPPKSDVTPADAALAVNVSKAAAPSSALVTQEIFSAAQLPASLQTAKRSWENFEPPTDPRKRPRMEPSGAQIEPSRAALVAAAAAAAAPTPIDLPLTLGPVLHPFDLPLQLPGASSLQRHAPVQLPPQPPKTSEVLARHKQQQQGIDHSKRQTARPSMTAQPAPVPRGESTSVSPSSFVPTPDQRRSMELARDIQLAGSSRSESTHHASNATSSRGSFSAHSKPSSHSDGSGLRRELAKSRPGQTPLLLPPKPAAARPSNNASHAMSGSQHHHRSYSSSSASSNANGNRFLPSYSPYSSSAPVVRRSGHDSPERRTDNRR
ncbi:hypothetical protein CAOG_01709 [Capsaspora owczarzaki ATCC 30864]|uniref:DNA2/NAM7 helicase helicase domain-containing protein n=1 Tax=Capsaspora owczarzaki (strain ATCC 30864) TaxID=595528 RepID=A0A0D2WJT3_CAPO3|nr:hypothetical protein CAOG_01709 [Capsaspora owczarzaki ATCC 30864]KJE90390.1 hypothetical protein, variant [Capsaspora owczarzaki ATCC 30864]|eukprot:XP_004364577.2 hypothetical protein CAOG_01709 [Capsaspora owczarzaki ATCC 30864]